MKIVIDIPEERYEFIKGLDNTCYDIHAAIAQGTPYNSSGDLISRSALIKAFNEAQVEFDEYYKGLGRAKVITDNAPTVEYTFEEAFQKTVCENRLYCPNKRPKAEWVWHKGGYYKCSNCGEVEKAKKNYCSNCGAPMIKDGEKHEDNN